MNEKNTAKYISARFKIRISFKHDYANKYKSAGKPDFKDVKFNYALSEN